MKKIVKEQPEAAKNRPRDVLPLFPDNLPIAMQTASLRQVFRTDLLKFCNTHVVKCNYQLKT